MRADPGSLYDAHAARLYAYCWSLLGDRAAADAVIGTFVAAVRHPPRGDAVLWLYALARSACMERGALAGLPDSAFDGAAQYGRPGGPAAARQGDPLLRAAARLRADQREVLLLWAGEWLEIDDIARVMGVAPDTARGLLHAARTRLERAVLDGLMRAPAATPAHMEVIAAFEKGRLPQLLARRAPARPPRGLRGRVLAACEAEARRPVSSVTTTSPLVVIGSEDARNAAPAGARRKAGKVGAAAGLAAAAAAVVGMVLTWPTSKGGGTAELVPTSRSDRTQAGSARPADGSPSATGEASRDGLTTGPFTQSTAPALPSAPGGPGGSVGSWTPGGAPSGGGVGSSAPDERRTATGGPSAPGSTSPGTPSATPSSPTQTTTPPPSSPPSTPPSTQPSTTPEEPEPGDSTPPSSPPATGSPEPPSSPTPTSNPTPSPAQD